MNRTLGFLPNKRTIDVLRAILKEIEVAINAGAYRSVTYLAVSAVEGLCGELLSLMKITRETPGVNWPLYTGGENKGKPKKSRDLKLEDKIDILNSVQALPLNFENLYHPIRKYRNLIHPEIEIKLEDLKPINESVALLAASCLSALIGKYDTARFIADQQWKLMVQR